MNMQTSTTDFLAHVDGLLSDPLRAAREASDAGMRVVGYFGDEIPRALIMAADALPVSLRGAAHSPTPQADEILESAFTPGARAVAERWLKGELDFLSDVVFSRADDSAQRLYYYLCELQRRRRSGGPRPLLYDIARIARTTSIAHSRDSTRRLAAELDARPEKLAPAVQRIARREALLADIRARRQADAPLPGGLAWRVRQAAACDWRESFDDAAQRWLPVAPALSPKHRVALAGNPLPDDSLHRVIEAAGGSVVAEFTEPSSTGIPGGAATLEALADCFHARRSPVLAMRADPSWSARCAREARADAVIFWLIEEDEALPWEIARQMNHLQAQRIPVLLLARRRGPAGTDDCRQVAEFVNRIEVTR